MADPAVLAPAAAAPAAPVAAAPAPAPAGVDVAAQAAAIPALQASAPGTAPSRADEAAALIARARELAGSASMLAAAASVLAVSASLIALEAQTLARQAAAILDRAHLAPVPASAVVTVPVGAAAPVAAAAPVLPTPRAAAPAPPTAAAASSPTSTPAADPAPAPTPPTVTEGSAPRASGGDGPDPTPVDPCNPDQPAGFATSAAATFGWGKPNRVEDFDGPLDRSWGLYDGPGHAGNGRRTPDAVTIENGVLTITGDPRGNTEGMAWSPGQKYGRWEGRVRAPASDRSYNALLLLWPDAENFPVGGEVDFMEMSDHTRQSTDMFLHYGKSNSQVQGNVKIDATQWHNWAVEWTPDHIAAFVDGKQWWRTDNTKILPPGPMHLCIQLDWFPRSGSSVQTSHMYVDWVRQYPLNADSANSADQGDDPTTSRTEGATRTKPGLVQAAVTVS